MTQQSCTAAMVIGVAALTVVGCARPVYTTPVVYSVETERIIDKPFDAVWQSAVEWFATHNTPIKNIDKASGLISTEYSLSMEEATAHMDCGSGDSSFMGKVELENPSGNFNIVIKRQDELSTQVKVNVFFTCTVNKYRYENLLSTNYVLLSSEKQDCKSKGTLEKDILDHVVLVSQQQPQQLQAPPPQGQCVSNDECRAGRVCREGACSSPVCMKDIDCPSPQVCEQGACVHPSSPCLKDTECPSNQICEEGVCVAH